MATVAENRALARAEHRIAQLERDLHFARERFNRCYHRSCLLEQLVRTQTSLLVALRDRDHRRMGLSMEQLVELRRRLREDV